MSRQKAAITTIITDRPMIPNARNKLIFLECSFTALKSFLDLRRGFAIDVVILLARQDRKRLPAIGHSARLRGYDVAIPEPAHERDTDQARVLQLANEPAAVVRLLDVDRHTEANKTTRVNLFGHLQNRSGLKTRCVREACDKNLARLGIISHHEYYTEA
jgi:hypothetical protein